MTQHDSARLDRLQDGLQLFLVRERHLAADADQNDIAFVLRPEQLLLQRRQNSALRLT